MAIARPGHADASKAVSVLELPFPGTVGMKQISIQTALLVPSAHPDGFKATILKRLHSENSQLAIGAWAELEIRRAFRIEARLQRPYATDEEDTARKDGVRVRYGD